jgi:hypothetical protein
MAQAELQAARQRFSNESLDEALKIAWEMLVAADHPTAAPERARHTRRLIAEAIVRAARDANDIETLWLAGIDAFRYEAFPQSQAASLHRRDKSDRTGWLRQLDKHIRQRIGVRLAVAVNALAH